MALQQLEVKVLFIAMLVGIAHVVAGMSVFMDPAALLSTALSTLYHASQVFDIPSYFFGAILVAAGAMAIIASSTSFTAHKAVHVTLLMPQQLLLLLQLFAISIALGTGRYPDGYIPIGGAWFVLCDQIWAWILAVTHSVWLLSFIYKGLQRWNK